jgi:hypothetical protein
MIRYSRTAATASGELMPAAARAAISATSTTPSPNGVGLNVLAPAPPHRSDAVIRPTVRTHVIWAERTGVRALITHKHAIYDGIQPGARYAAAREYHRRRALGTQEEYFQEDVGAAGTMLTFLLIVACSSTGQHFSTQRATQRHPASPVPIQVQIGAPAETRIDGKPIKFSLLTADQFARLTSSQLARLAASGQAIGIEFNPEYSIDSVLLNPQPFVVTDAKGHKLPANFGMAALHTGEKIMLVILTNTAADIASYSIDPSGTKFVAVGFLQPALPDARHDVELFDRGQSLKRFRIKYADVNPNAIMFVVESAYQVRG